MDVQKAVDAVLPMVEEGVKALIKKESAHVVDMLLDEAKKLIPGAWDDLLIEKNKAKIEALVEARLLALAEQISKA
jgi:hypothetical protein